MPKGKRSSSSGDTGDSFAVLDEVRELALFELRKPGNDPTDELSLVLKILWFGIQDSGGQPLLHKENLAELLRTSAGNCDYESEIVLAAILLDPAGRRGDVSSAFEEFLNKAADPDSDLRRLQDSVLGRYLPINPDTGELLEPERMMRDPEFIRRRAKQLAGFYDKNWAALIRVIAVGICAWPNVYKKIRSGFTRFIRERRNWITMREESIRSEVEAVVDEGCAKGVKGFRDEFPRDRRDTIQRVHAVVRRDQRSARRKEEDIEEKTAKKKRKAKKKPVKPRHKKPETDSR